MYINAACNVFQLLLSCDNWCCKLCLNVILINRLVNKVKFDFFVFSKFQNGQKLLKYRSGSTTWLTRLDKLGFLILVTNSTQSLLYSWLFITHCQWVIAYVLPWYEDKLLFPSNCKDTTVNTCKREGKGIQSCKRGRNPWKLKRLKSEMQG